MFQSDNGAGTVRVAEGIAARGIVAPSQVDAITNVLLEKYTLPFLSSLITGNWSGYSLRRLSPGAVNAVEIRRGDGLTVDIPFNSSLPGGAIDPDNITSIVGNNLIGFSNDFTQPNWIKDVSFTLTPNYLIAPNGAFATRLESSVVDAAGRFMTQQGTFGFSPGLHECTFYIRLNTGTVSGNEAIRLVIPGNSYSAVSVLTFGLLLNDNDWHLITLQPFSDQSPANQAATVDLRLRVDEPLDLSISSFKFNTTADQEYNNTLDVAGPGRQPNRLTDSNNFTGTDWSSNAILTPNFTDDPFGGLDGWRYESDGTINRTVTQILNAEQGEQINQSLYVKSNIPLIPGGIQLLVNGAGLDTQIINIDPLLTEDWQRFDHLIDIDLDTDDLNVIFRTLTGGIYDLSIAFGQTENDELTDYVDTGATSGPELKKATVSTWYDQGSIADNATQVILEEQPIIALDGAVILENGLPALLFIGAERMRTLGSNLSDNYSVSNPSLINTGSLWGGLNSTRFDIFTNDTMSFAVSGDTIQTSNGGTGPKVRTVKTQTSQIFINSEEGNYTNQDVIAGQPNLRAIGNRDVGTPDFFDGIIQEIILTEDDQSNRVDIESNINNYYEIF